MGNSISCNCCETSKERVVIMRSDGTVLKFKKGVQVKEVMLAYSGHRVVRFDSDRTVLWGGAELKSNRVYFLVPEDKARCSKMFEKFQKIFESKGFRTPLKPNKETTAAANGEVCESRRGSWTPQLRTILEILSSSSMSIEGKEISGLISVKKSPLENCSLDEQVTVAFPLLPPLTV